MNKKLLKHFFAFFLLVLLNFSLYQVAQAGILDTVNNGGLSDIGSKGFDTTGTPQDIRVTIAKIINRLLGFLGIIFVALIMYAGFQWMTAQGDAKKIEAAKGYIQNGTIGLIIVLSSMALADFLMGCVIGVTGNTGGVFFGGICNQY